MKLREAYLSPFSIIIVLAVYYLVNQIALLGIGRLFGWADPAWWVLFAITLSFPLAFLFEKTMPSWLTKLFFIIACTWMGVVFLLMCAYLVVELLLLAVPIPKAGVLVLVVGLSASLYALINAFRTTVKTVRLAFGKKLRVVQLTDVHLGTIWNGPFLDRIVSRVNALRPDIVVITGDLVDGSAPLHDGMVSAIDKIVAPVFLINGNHENFEGYERIDPILKKTKLRLLRDEVVVCNGVQIIGLDYTIDSAKALAALQKIRLDKKPSILLYHIPELYEEAAAKGIDLELSGHTHNGQIWPFTYLVRLHHPHIKGLYTVKSGKRTMHHYVSPGTGTWGPPMRLGSRNEITLFELG